MPSRFLSLWSLLSKPSTSSTSSSSSKSKKTKDALSTSQTGGDSTHPWPLQLYGDGEDLQVQQSEKDESSYNGLFLRRSNLSRKTATSFADSQIDIKGSATWRNRNSVPVEVLLVDRHQNQLGSIAQRSGRVNQPKRVAPPTVPDYAPNRNSGSSFTSTASTESSSGGYCSGEGSATSGWSSDQRSSLGLDDPFLPPASPGVHSLTNKSMFHEGGNLPSPNQAGVFNFPGQQGSVYGQMVNRSGNQATSPAGKVDREPGITLLPYPNYMQQASIEDQGIDLTQSPGRESPSSSTGSSSSTSAGLKSSCSSAAGTSVLPGCRYSTTSLDSGRASAYDHAHRHGSSSSSSSGGMVVHQHQHKLSTGSYAACFRHSYHSSSSSLGSSGKTDDIHRLDFAEMLAQGVPEHEVLNAWLTDMGFEEYYDLFVQAGYDMHTITRMTPEDLTAIGIQKPIHRKKLKAEIAQLSIPDGLPDFIPDSLEEWLALLGLAEYSPSLRRQGYRTVEDVTQLTWEDLEDFGILRLGHQKKILLAIKRVKDILSGKWAPPAPADSCCCCHETSDQSISSFQQTRSLHYAAAGPGQAVRYSAQQQQHVYLQYKQPLYQPDVVAIQIHRNKSSEDVQNVNTACQGQYPGTSLCKPAWRSYEDGDITPISENAGQLRSAGGGTLPRPRGSVKPRPVAKISAKTRMDGESQENDVQKVHFHGQPNINYSRNAHALGSQPVYGTLAKKHPPPPPKRSLSAEDDPSSVYGHIGKSSPLLPPPPAIFDRQNNATDSHSLLSYSEDSDDFPPPPAPITASDSYLQHGQASAAASVRERLDNILQRSGAAHWPRPPGTATMPNPRLMKSDRECSPCDGNETSDTEPGSPAAEFRQRRNGSDASFKSTSSTESDSMPFANDNAGTIKQRAARQHQALSGLAYTPARTPKNSEATDVLNDIGSMLAGLAVELDAMLEEENKQKA